MARRFRKLKGTIANLRIHNKLMIGFAVLIILPLFSLTALIVVRTGDLIRKETKENMEFAAYQTATNVDLFLGNIKDLVFSLQSDEMIQTLLTEIEVKGRLDTFETVSYRRSLTNALFRSTFTDEVEYVRVTANQGLFAQLDKADFMESSTNFDITKMNQGLGGVVWFDYHPSTDTVLLAAVINSILTQKPLGYVVMHMRQPPLRNLFSQTVFQENGDLYIIDRNNRIISYNKAITSASIPERYATQMDQDAKQGFYEQDGHFVVYHRLENAPWYVVARASTHEIEQPLAKLYTTIIIVVLLIAGTSMFLAILFSRTISSPIRRLTRVMKRFSEGDLDIRSDMHSTNEVGQLSASFNDMVQNINILIQKNLSETLSKQQAELKSLRMQVNPHFIYNTLETINWMARSKEVPDIGEVAKSLGDLLRKTISGSDFITIESEMGAVRNYMTIQQYRYGDMLHATMEVAPEIHPLLIPKMILQPIIENAIMHGMENAASGLEIWIAGRLEAGDIMISIRDNGVGIENDRLQQIMNEEYDFDEDQHTHIGIRNVDTRLKMHYGEKYGLHIVSEPGVGTEVILRLPGQTQPPENS